MKKNRIIKNKNNKKITIEELQSYELRLKANNKRTSLAIAWSLSYRYVKYFKFSIFIAAIASIFATFINILLVLGINYLTQALQNLYSAISLGSTDTYVSILGLNVNMNEFFPVLMLAIILLVFYLLFGIFSFTMNFILVKIANLIGYHLRMDLFNKIQALKLQYYDTHESGDIMSVLSNDVFRIVIFISQHFGQLVMGIIMFLGMLIVMFLISPYLTLIVFIFVIIKVIYVAFLSIKSNKAFFNQQTQLGHINGYIEEIISAHNIVNLFKREKLTESNFARINDTLNKESERAQVISGMFIPSGNFLNNFTTLFMTCVAIVFVVNKVPLGSSIFGDLQGDIVITISVINVFILALRNFVVPINSILGLVSELQQAMAGARRTSNIFIQDVEDTKDEVINVNKLTGKINIKNLNFSYEKNKPVLKNLNLEVLPGQTVAIVGPTGSGKTTIINLLTKFYDIDEGKVVFDDEFRIQNISKKSIRDQVSIVLQDTYLFSGTIKENIRYAKPDASDEEIVNVSKIANCHHFIMQLENGYDTVLSENATELSQGQKQLIAIARAMLSKSSILILDEATSNVDTRTERIIQEAMYKLVATKTAFVIAHRLSTIKKADKIVVLKNGEIIEIGNHDQLMKLHGFYYKLNQSKSGIVDEVDM